MSLYMTLRIAFKALGRKMGEFMDGRPEVLRLREVE
jgi:alpha/beta superfamily hydrolase